MNIPIIYDIFFKTTSQGGLSCWISLLEGFFSPWPGDPRVKVMVDKELPVYVMTLIAMSCAVAWQHMLPQKNTSYLEKNPWHSHLCIIVFFGERKKHTLLFWSFFHYKKWHIWKFLSLPDGLVLFWWTGSGLCYKGSYAYGAPPPAEEPLPSGKLYIKGTWTVPFLHEVNFIHGFCFSYNPSIYF